MSAVEIDAGDLAAIATNDADPDAGDDADDDDIEEDGGEEGDTSSSSATRETVDVKEMLMRTEPNDSLATIESPYDPQNGGLTRVYRGFRKMLGFDALPAIGDVIVGTIEVFKGADAGGGDAGEGQEASDDGGDAPGPINGGEGV